MRFIKIFLVIVKDIIWSEKNICIVENICSRHSAS